MQTFEELTDKHKELSEKLDAAHEELKDAFRAHNYEKAHLIAKEIAALTNELIVIGDAAMKQALEGLRGE